MYFIKAPAHRGGGGRGRHRQIDEDMQYNIFSYLL